MRYYISSTGQQTGPTEEAEVIAALTAGRLSPNDLGIPEGGKEWKPLSQVFPNASQTSGSPVAASVSATAPKKRRWGMVLGILGALLLGILAIGGVIGFIVYRNLFPADSLTDLPNAVGPYKLEKRNPPHGDVWGSKTWYFGMYTLTPGGSDSIVYLMDVYKDEATAKSELELSLNKDCKNGDKPLRFSFLKNGTEVSEGSTCYGAFYIHKGNRVATVSSIGKLFTLDDVKSFMNSLPLNEGSKMSPKADK